MPSHTPQMAILHTAHIAPEGAKCYIDSTQDGLELASVVLTPQSVSLWIAELQKVQAVWEMYYNIPPVEPR